MESEKKAISKLKFAPYNPRKMKKSEFEKLKRSIETFNCYEPLIVNSRTWHVVGGNQRLRALKELGYEEVEVVIVDLSLEKEKLLNIALNRILGEFIEDQLAALIEGLDKIPDIDVSLSGFDVPEISEILDSLNPPAEDEFDFNSFVDAIEEPITKRGDLIELGPHKILCGDSSSEDDLRILLGNEKVHLVQSDPPYNVNYYGGNRPNTHSRPSNHKLWQKIYSDNMTQEQYEAWLKKIFTNITPFLAEGAPIYVWNGHRQFGPMYLMLRDLGFHISCVITWAKEHFAFGYGDYSQQTEFCLYGWKEDGRPHIWYGPTNETTLWQIKRDVAKTYIHPTQKPIALPQRAIKNSSKRGNVVLDLFLGSGSTLIAAESLDRKCYGMEIDPKYVDGIVKRYIAYVGKDRVSPEIRQRYVKEVHHG